MNQSELETDTDNRRQARENACEQDTIGFGFMNVTWVFSQLQRVVMKNQK